MRKAGKDSCEDMKEMNFLILGMHCASCAASVERAVKKMDGVTKVYVNLATKTMTLSAEESVTPGMIIERVTDSGFRAQLIEDRRQTREDEEAGGRYFLRFLTALIFSILLFYAAMSGMLGLPYPPIPPLANAFVQIALLIPVLLAGRLHLLSLRLQDTGKTVPQHGFPDRARNKRGDSLQCLPDRERRL